MIKSIVHRGHRHVARLMPNVQVSLLMLSSLRLSPAIMNGVANLPSRCILEKMRIVHSFSSFLMDISASPRIYIKGSYFAQFLRSPIIVKSIVLMNTSFYLSSFSLILESEVNITTCTFSSCQSPSRGGAILYYQPSSSASSLCISYSAFLACSAMKGGACYAEGSGARISATCFHECLADESGHSMYIYCHMPKNSILMAITIFKCPYSNFTGKGSIFLMEGNHNINYVNSSNNVAPSSEAVAFFQQSTDYTYFRNCFIHNNSGISVFSLRNISDLRLTFCTVCLNKIYDSLIYSYSTYETPNVIILCSKFEHNRRADGHSQAEYGPGTFVRLINVTLRNSKVDEESRASFGQNSMIWIADPHDGETEPTQYYYASMIDACNLLIPTTASSKVNGLAIIVVSVSSACIAALGAMTIVVYRLNEKQRYENWLTGK